MTNLIEESKKNAKTIVPVIAATAALAPVNVFANTVTANADLVSAANTAVQQVEANINAVLPIALPLIGIVMAITAGIRVFKRITGAAVSG